MSHAALALTAATAELLTPCRRPHGAARHFSLTQGAVWRAAIERARKRHRDTYRQTRRMAKVYAKTVTFLGTSCTELVACMLHGS